MEPGPLPKRVPVLLQARSAGFIGLHDDTPLRIRALLAAGAQVTVRAPVEPIALSVEVVDRLVTWHRRMPRHAEFASFEAVFIQTGGAAEDRASAALACVSGVSAVVIEGHGACVPAPETLRMGSLTLLWQPLALGERLGCVWHRLRAKFGRIRPATAMPLRRTPPAPGELAA